MKKQMERVTQQPVDADSTVPDGPVSDLTGVNDIAPALRTMPRRLEMRRAFQGAMTGERVIYPGLYFEDDPRLLGLVDYLIAQGFGVWV